MTLSHCWGNAQFYRLTSTTYDELIAGIPLTRLTKTFQDAVYTAGKLGAAYLWIDSFCIIQDSVEDWLKESTTMCDVYKGSYCNIAAAASTSSDGGCFRERTPRLIEPCILSTQFNNMKSEDYILDLSFRERENEETQPLFRRGWVVQERILAPRALNFADQLLFWECRTSHSSEIRPIYDYSKFPPKQSLIIAEQDVTSPGYKNRALRKWWDIIQEYALCSLTHGTDKLIAISGLAKEFQILGGPEDYIAGIWRYNLTAQLLWSAKPVSDPSGPRNYRPELYRAPTWSWASMDGPISTGWLRYHERRLAKVVDIRIIHNTGDKYGGVKSATLRMSGCLRTLSFEGSGDRQDDGIWFKNLLLGGSNYSWSVKCHAVFHMDLPDSRLEDYESSLHLFVIAREKEGSDLFFRTQGLVLAPTGLVMVSSDVAACL